MDVSGFGGSVIDQVSPSILFILAGLFAIACYNSMEICIITFITFKKYSSLYYWAMCAANIGIAMHSTGTILRFLGIGAPVPMTILGNIGWWFMTTGQFLVLYSRLHLVVGKYYKLQWILALIGTVFLCFQLPTSVLFVISNAKTPDAVMIKKVFHVLEIMQLTAFTVQEGIMSGLYVYEFSRMLYPLQLIHGPRVMPIFRQLVTMLILVVGLDISLILTYCTGHFIIETSCLAVVYSIKLKAELLVLDTLISLLRIETRRCCAVSRHSRGQP